MDHRGSLDLELPERATLSLLLPGRSIADEGHGCSFNFVDRAHATRHACSLLSILHAAASPGNDSRHRFASFNKHLPWLIDSLEALNEDQKRWAAHHDHPSSSLLKLALNLTHSSSGLDQIVLRKLDAIIVLLSADVAGRPNEPDYEDQTTPAANRTLSLALLHLADAAINCRPISKLVTAQLLKPLDNHLTEVHVNNDVDLQVSLPMSSLCIA